MSFCRNCLCPGCVEQSLTAKRLRDAQQAVVDHQNAKIQAQLDDMAARRVDSTRLGIMIWLLTPADATSAATKTYDIAEAMDTRTGEINERRRLIVKELDKRTQRFAEEYAAEPFAQRLLKARAVGGVQIHLPWAKINGSPLPRVCPICGDMVDKRGRHSQSRGTRCAVAAK